MQNFSSQIVSNFSFIVVILGILVHLILAAGVAKDVNNFSTQGIGTQLINGASWVMVVLITGIWGILVYWLIHHSTLGRYRSINIHSK